ncbi:MAG TPA: hypothetical protein VHQ48_16140, partial [Bradyrhizobium sp.]|jgi:Asp-tRNA(Asn)/Glu-tRNA(Gln) amidotransferase A subunit family amidase|nr:hypothetical protein [Bradyrhizobium sp.]
MDPGYVATGKAGRQYTAEQLMVAGMQRAALARHMNFFYRDWDLLVTPTLAVASVPAGCIDWRHE